MAGFGIGVYVGTYYECKPALEYIRKVITEQVPKKRDDDDDDL